MVINMDYVFLLKGIILLLSFMTNYENIISQMTLLEYMLHTELMAVIKEIFLCIQFHGTNYF